MVLIDPVQGGLDGAGRAPAETPPVDSSARRRPRLVGDSRRVVAAEQGARRRVAGDDLGARHAADALDERRDYSRPVLPLGAVEDDSFALVDRRRDDVVDGATHLRRRARQDARVEHRQPAVLEGPRERLVERSRRPQNCDLREHGQGRCLIGNCSPEAIDVAQERPVDELRF